MPVSLWIFNPPSPSPISSVVPHIYTVQDSVYFMRGRFWHHPWMLARAVLYMLSASGPWWCWPIGAPYCYYLILTCRYHLVLIRTWILVRLQCQISSSSSLWFFWQTVSTFAFRRYDDGDVNRWCGWLCGRICGHTTLRRIQNRCSPWQPSLLLTWWYSPIKRCLSSDLV